MNYVRAVPTSIEGLRTAAHDVANALAVSDIGGECYHGGLHTCFSRQGRKPLPLYKVEELCERCAASWHAVMTAALIDSVVVGQQFLGIEPTTKLEQHFLHSGNGATVVGATVSAKRRPSPPKASSKPRMPRKSRSAPKKLSAVAPDQDADTAAFDIAIKPKPNGKYTPEEREQIVAFYKPLPRGRKSSFNQRYSVHAWQMRDWSKKK